MDGWLVCCVCMTNQNQRLVFVGKEGRKEESLTIFGLEGLFAYVLSCAGSRLHRVELIWDRISV